MKSYRRNRQRRAVSRTDRVLIMSIVLAASVFPVDLQPGVQRESRGANGQLTGKQGQVLLLPISVEGSPSEVSGRFIGRQIAFFPNLDPAQHGQFLGLIGIDMNERPGSHELVIEVRSSQEQRRLSYEVLVVQERFPVQHLTLPNNQVDLDPKTLVRVKAEQKEVRRVLDIVSPERYWKGRFVEPVEGTVAGAFGRKRVINGQPRSPHSGEDISAPRGAAVVSSNDGIVRGVVDHFFSGKGVFVDHGYGLHSMYFHLSEVLAREGERVERGQVIGRVGASGRATGPHLHWGVRLNGARVDPYALTRLPLTGTARSSIQ